MYGFVALTYKSVTETKANQPHTQLPRQYGSRPVELALLPCSGPHRPARRPPATSQHTASTQFPAEHPSTSSLPSLKSGAAGLPLTRGEHTSGGHVQPHSSSHRDPEHSKLPLGCSAAKDPPPLTILLSAGRAGIQQSFKANTQRSIRSTARGKVEMATAVFSALMLSLLAATGQAATVRLGMLDAYTAPAHPAVKGHHRSSSKVPSVHL